MCEQQQTEKHERRHCDDDEWPTFPNRLRFRARSELQQFGEPFDPSHSSRWNGSAVGSFLAHSSCYLAAQRLLQVTQRIVFIAGQRSLSVAGP
jgi:hypothetical protein